MFLKDIKKILFSFIIFISLLILIILNILKAINYTYITGFILATFFCQIAFLLFRKANKNLIEKLNPYYYVFLSITRIGFYFVPFLISFYLPNIFNVYGLLIALIVNSLLLFF